MTARFRLRRERGEEGAVHALRTVAVTRARAGRRDADVPDHHRRGLEGHDLPTINVSGPAQLLAQNGGGSISIIQRAMVAARSVWVTSNGVSRIASSPMLPACT